MGAGFKKWPREAQDYLTATPPPFPNNHPLQLRPLSFRESRVWRNAGLELVLALLALLLELDLAAGGVLLQVVLEGGQVAIAGVLDRHLAARRLVQDRRVPARLEVRRRRVVGGGVHLGDHQVGSV